MTAKERCADILDKFPEERLPYIAAFLEDAYRLIEDALDDAYCLELYNQSPEEEGDGIPIEQLSAELGIQLL